MDRIILSSEGATAHRSRQVPTRLLTPANWGSSKENRKSAAEFVSLSQYETVVHHFEIGSQSSGQLFRRSVKDHFSHFVII